MVADERERGQPVWPRKFLLPRANQDVSENVHLAEMAGRDERGAVHLGDYRGPLDHIVREQFRAIVEFRAGASARAPKSEFRPSARRPGPGPPSARRAGLSSRLFSCTIARRFTNSCSTSRLKGEQPAMDFVERARSPARSRFAEGRPRPPRQAPRSPGRDSARPPGRRSSGRTAARLPRRAPPPRFLPACQGFPRSHSAEVAEKRRMISAGGLVAEPRSRVTVGAKHARAGRHDHRPASEQRSQRVGVQRAGAAESHQREAARIVALLDRDQAQRAEHVLVDDVDYSRRRLHQSDPERGRRSSSPRFAPPGDRASSRRRANRPADSRVPRWRR